MVKYLYCHSGYAVFIEKDIDAAEFIAFALPSVYSVCLGLDAQESSDIANGRRREGMSD